MCVIGCVSRAMWPTCELLCVACYTAATSGVWYVVDGPASLASTELRTEGSAEGLSFLDLRGTCQCWLRLATPGTMHYLRASDAVTTLFVLAIVTSVPADEDGIAHVASPSHPLAWLFVDTLHRRFGCVATVRPFWCHVIEFQASSAAECSRSDGVDESQRFPLDL